MEQLSGLDASFLYLETNNAPMQIGGLSILTAETPRGRLGLEEVRALIGSRLHLSRTFRQKLVPVPLNLGKPYWVDDPDFDLDNHVERTQLPAPGGLRELSALMAFELEQPLDRRRPLWRVLLVEGLGKIGGIPDDCVGLISMVHHAAIDGMSGSELIGTLFDPSPVPRAVPEPEAAPVLEAPNPLQLLSRASKNLLRTPSTLPATLKNTARGVANLGMAALRRLEPPPRLFTAPRTRFNAPISRQRSWGAALLSLERIKRIKKAADATVNDVVLTVCAGALRRHLEATDGLPEKSLIAMVPVSVRDESERGAMGNLVSAMLVALATDEADPRERLHKIHQNAVQSKIYHQAIGARTLTDYVQYVPFSLAGLGAQLYTRLHLAERHDPLFNLVITNVPGPRVPLYVAGARLICHLGAAPVFDGLGLILPIFSYADTLAIGITGDRKILPDASVLADQLKASLDELEAAVI